MKRASISQPWTFIRMRDFFPRLSIVSVDVKQHLGEVVFSVLARIFVIREMTGSGLYPFTQDSRDVLDSTNSGPDFMHTIITVTSPGSLCPLYLFLRGVPSYSIQPLFSTLSLSPRAFSIPIYIIFGILTLPILFKYLDHHIGLSFIISIVFDWTLIISVIFSFLDVYADIRQKSISVVNNLFAWFLLMSKVSVPFNLTVSNDLKINVMVLFTRFFLFHKTKFSMPVTFISSALLFSISQ